MRRSRRLSASCSSCRRSGRSGAQQAPQQPQPQPAAPVFRSGVEALPIDVTVVDGRGEPVRDLIASDFTVRLDGKPRRVLSAQWIASAGDAKAPAASLLPEGYVSNEQSAGGRLIVLVIDQPNIPFGEMRPMRDAIEAFIDRLSSADRVAIVGFGNGAKSTSFLSDRDQLKQALARLPGQQQRSGVGIGIARSGPLHGARHRPQRRVGAQSGRVARLPGHAARHCAVPDGDSSGGAADCGRGADERRYHHPEPARRADQSQSRGRAQNADAGLAGVFRGRAARRQSAPDRDRRAGVGGAHEHLCVQTRRQPERHHARAGVEPDIVGRRSTRTPVGTRDVDRSGARCAVRSDRHGHERVRARQRGVVGVLPARRRARPSRSGRQGASHPRGRRPKRRRRPHAPDHAGWTGRDRAGAGGPARSRQRARRGKWSRRRSARRFLPRACRCGPSPLRSAASTAEKSAC